MAPALGCSPEALRDGKVINIAQEDDGWEVIRRLEGAAQLLLLPAHPVGGIPQHGLLLIHLAGGIPQHGGQSLVEKLKSKIFPESFLKLNQIFKETVLVGFREYSEIIKTYGDDVTKSNPQYRYRSTIFKPR